MTENFFDESTDQSRVKARIVAKYFKAWAGVILGAREKYRPGQDKRLAYIDLFAGPGRYKDGTNSTPLLILEQAVSDPALSANLVTIFNDLDSKNQKSLESAIKALPGIEKLKYPPQVSNDEVGTKIVQEFEESKFVPTLFFVDPWGYKGLSLKLVNSVLKDWGCDCVFFFNYTRINMGLSNSSVARHMKALFEEQFEPLAEKINGMKSGDRELAIVEELAQCLKRYGGRYVLPFGFKNAKGSRTTHHLIFVSKHFRGYEIMKDVMARESEEAEGVPTFCYNPAPESFPLLFAYNRAEGELPAMLLEDLAGRRTLTVRKIYEEHSPDTPFLLSHYKTALKKLESQKKIVTDPPAAKRVKRKGEVTMADHVKVTFPK